MGPHRLGLPRTRSGGKSRGKGLGAVLVAAWGGAGEPQPLKSRRPAQQPLQPQVSSEPWLLALGGGSTLVCRRQDTLGSPLSRGPFGKDLAVLFRRGGQVCKGQKSPKLRVRYWPGPRFRVSGHCRSWHTLPLSGHPLCGPRRQEPRVRVFTAPDPAERWKLSPSSAAPLTTCRLSASLAAQNSTGRAGSWAFCPPLAHGVSRHGGKDVGRLRPPRPVQAGGDTGSRPGASPVSALAPKYLLLVALANPGTLGKGYLILYLVGSGRRTSPGRPTVLPSLPGAPAGARLPGPRPPGSCPPAGRFSRGGTDPGPGPGVPSSSGAETLCSPRGLFLGRRGTGQQDRNVSG